MALAVRYLGDGGAQAAEEALRTVHPDANFVRKVAGVFEVCVPVPPDLATRLPRDWQLYEPTEAEIAPPRLTVQSIGQVLKR
jgi:hypothetical protein